MIDYEWLVLQGMEGYFLDPGFDQNSMQDMLTGFPKIWNPAILQPAHFQEYATSIHVKGAALDNCFVFLFLVFIDGTVRPICQPGEDEHIVYNGHKRVHALKC